MCLQEYQTMETIFCQSSPHYRLLNATTPGVKIDHPTALKDRPEASRVTFFWSATFLAGGRLFLSSFVSGPCNICNFSLLRLLGLPLSKYSYELLITYLSSFAKKAFMTVCFCTSHCTVLTCRI